MRSAYRRKVFHSVLTATARRLPDWARECPKAQRDNRDFIAAYREAYTAFRREMRAAPRPA